MPTPPPSNVPPFLQGFICKNLVGSPVPTPDCFPTPASLTLHRDTLIRYVTRPTSRCGNHLGKRCSSRTNRTGAAWMTGGVWRRQVGRSVKGPLGGGVPSRGVTTRLKERVILQNGHPIERRFGKQNLMINVYWGVTRNDTIPSLSSLGQRTSSTRAAWTLEQPK